MPNASEIAVLAPESRSDKREPNLQSQAGRSGRFAAAPPQRKPRFAARQSSTLPEGSKQVSYHLVQPSAEDWKNQEPEVTARYYDQTELDFFAIVNDYLNQANWAAERYRSSLLSHRRWRFWIIIATGILTAINVCAALALLEKPFWGEISPAAFLSVVAALYAAGLTVAGNVESFFNRVEEAAGFREMRDLLLNRYREYRSKWLYYVEAYGKTPAACVNAGQLYCQLVDSDQELRQKIKQLTEVRGPKGDKQSPGGQR
jgi:hypothetical protein